MGIQGKRYGDGAGGGGGGGDEAYPFFAYQVYLSLYRVILTNAHKQRYRIY